MGSRGDDLPCGIANEAIVGSRWMISGMGMSLRVLAQRKVPAKQQSRITAVSTTSAAIDRISTVLDYLVRRPGTNPE